MYADEAADGGVYEECDDGDGEVGDGCTAECAEETCGDGMIGWSRPRDGFEEGFELLPWATGVAVGWDGPFALTTAGTATPHGGETMAMSASPATGFDDTRAFLQIVVDVVGPSQACFWYTGDGPFFSTFRFGVNGTAAFETTGIGSPIPWTELCVDVPAGDDTVFLWEYEQGWMEGGEVVYIDDVTLALVQEVCDDGNTESGDGCSAVCRAE